MRTRKTAEAVFVLLVEWIEQAERSMPMRFRPDPEKCAKWLDDFAPDNQSLKNIAAWFGVSLPKSANRKKIVEAVSLEVPAEEIAAAVFDPEFRSKQSTRGEC